MLYHLTVLYLISKAAGQVSSTTNLSFLPWEVSSTTNPSSFPTRSTSSPTTSNRLLETALYKHCPIPEWHDSDCSDNVILSGTQCKIWRICNEDEYPIPALRTCQENKEWAGEEPGRSCLSDPCPIIEGFQMYPTGGCEGRNELGEFKESLQDCRTRCLQEDTCVSFEYAKDGFDYAVEVQRCALSTTCNYDKSIKLLYSPTCLYVKGLDVDGGDGPSNNDGEHTHFRHCVIDGNLAMFTTRCDGNILAGTRCDFEYLCKESQYSKSTTLTCMPNGTWEGELLDNGMIYDPNCYMEPTRQPTYAPVKDTPAVPPNDSRGRGEGAPSSREDGVCLAYDSDVSLADGTTQPIHSLQVGTNVALGNDDQSAIVFFSHADKVPVMRNMVTIKTQETSITATRNHLIFSSEHKDVTLRNLRAFEEVKIGDYVLMDSQSGPVSTKVTDIIYQRMFTRVFNAVPEAGYLIANKIFVASGVAFGILPHWLQYPVVHAFSMLVCGISERSCQIKENETKPRWVRSIQEWIAAMDLNRVSSAMMLTGSYT